MGNNRNNRFKNAEECTEYLKQMNLNDLICVKYGGKFKAKSIFRCNKDKYEWESTLDDLLILSQLDVLCVVGLLK